MALLEDWSERTDLSPLDRLLVNTAAVQLGSEPAHTELERTLRGIEDFDAKILWEDDKSHHTISHALRQIRHRLRPFPMTLIERILASKRYNIAQTGVTALAARHDRDALERLVALHASDAEWMLRDLAANQIELLAAKLQVPVRRNGQKYVLD